MYTRVGTKNYMAPELIEKRPYRGTSVDIFAAGVVLFAMMTGSMPFEKNATTDDYLYKHIVQKNYHKFWDEWEKTPEAQEQKKDVVSMDFFKDLIEKMLAYDYSERPTLQEIKNHPWFTQKLPSLEEVKAEIIKVKMHTVNKAIVNEVSKRSDELGEQAILEEQKLIEHFPTISKRKSSHKDAQRFEEPNG